MSVCPQGGPHVTITHDALDFIVQSDMEHGNPPPPASDIWRPVQTCSLDFTVQLPPELTPSGN